ncbi:MAG: T9SS type A sorting domain-containing protein [Haliscomenobacter sp.]|uniref:T9SS type A sorting domain-containing protein n=1 Tax=Haliscomenobacter sp. TaxID=2717303 RepID=UPI0029B67C30|nr:T9SS type A sorting domain-containing protein [Haliscomenobacter sp.]MDX2072539.1 T9SS type A sorting domain-containing protein [Haliscomenobacter sp.]
MKKLQLIYFIVFSVSCFTSLTGQSRNFCPRLWFSFSDTAVCYGDTLRNVKVYSNIDAYRVRLALLPGYRGQDYGLYHSGTQVYPDIPFSKINDTLYEATFHRVALPANHFGYVGGQTFEIHALLDQFPAETSNCQPLPYAFFTILYRETSGSGRWDNTILCNGQTNVPIQLGSEHELVYDQVWTNNNPNIGLPATGKNLIPSFVASNQTGQDQVATITVQAVARDGRNVCPISPNTFTIKVTHVKQPRIQMPPSPQIVCYGDTTQPIEPIVIHDGPYTLRWKAVGWVPTGIPADTGRLAFPSYVVDTRQPGANWIEFQAEASGQCRSEKSAFYFIHRPKVEIKPIEDRWFCNGAYSNPITFPGREYRIEHRWTMKPSLPGLPTQGIGDIPSKFLVHQGKESLSANVEVSASLVPELWFMDYNNEWGSNYFDVLSNSDIPVVNPKSTVLYAANAKVSKIKIIPQPHFAWLRPKYGEIPLTTPADTLIISGDGNSLYAINQTQGLVYKISTTSNQVESQNNLRATIRCSALSSDGQKLYFALRGQTTLLVLNAQTLTAIETITLPGRIESMLPFPDGTGLSLRFLDSLNIGLWDFTSKRIVARFGVRPGIKFYANAKAVNKLYIYDGSAYPIRITAVNLAKRALDTIIYPDINVQGQVPIGSAYELFPNYRGDLIYLNTYPISYLDTYRDTLIQDQYFTSAKKILLMDYDECESEAQTFNITLRGNPLPPKIELPLTQTLCPGVMSKSIALNELYPGLNFRWAKVDSIRDINTDAPNSGYGTIPSFKAPISDHNFLHQSEFKLYPSFKINDSVCVMPSLKLHYNFIGSFRAYGIPDVPDQLLTTGAKTQAVNLSFYANEITRLKWTNDNPSIGLPVNGVNNIPSVVAQNPSNSQTQVANFKISREILLNTDNICKDTSKSFQMRVLPFAVPSVDSIPNLTICYGDSIPRIKFKGPVTQARYRWRVIENPGYNLAENGENTLPAFRAYRGSGRGDQEELIKVVVTPVANVGQDSSVGKERQFNILIRIKAIPQPQTDQVFCHNEHANLNPYPPFYSFAQFSKPSLLIPINPDVAPLNYTTNNEGLQPDSGIFKLWVKYPDQVCAVDTHRFEVKVFPRPTLPIVEQFNTLCSGTIFPGVNFNTNIRGFDLRWTNSNPNIGLPASGQGSIPSFQTQANSSRDENAVIKLSVFAQGSNQELCDDLFSEFNVRVIARPKLSSLADLTLNTCEPSLNIGFSSNVRFTGYRWTNNRPDLGLVSSGLTNLPPFTPVNTSGRADTMTIVVTPFSFNQCEGKAESFRIIILPNPELNKIPDMAPCWEQVVNPINFGKVPEGSLVKWEIDQAIGLPLQGTGNIPAFRPSLNARGKSASIKFRLSFEEQLSYAYRSDNGSAWISWLDAQKNNINNSLNLAINPIVNANLLMHPSGRRLYAAAPENTVINVFDPLRHALLTTIDLNPAFSTCYFLNHAVLSRDGNFIFISKKECSTISIIDTRSNSITEDISTGMPVGALALSADGNKLYALSELGFELVTYDAHTWKLLKRVSINLDNGVSDCLIDPGNDQLLILNKSQKKLYRLDPSSGTVNVRLNLSGEPSEMKIPSNGNLAYLSLQPQGVYSFDHKSSNPALSRVPGTSPASAFSLSTNEESLFVTQPSRNTILQLRTRDAYIQDSILLSLGAPLGIAVVPPQQCSPGLDSFHLSFKDCLQEPILKLDSPDRNRIGTKPPSTPQDQRLWEKNQVDLQGVQFIVGLISPNPFQDITKLPIYAPYDCTLRLTLYDVMGRQVKELTPAIAKGWAEIQISKSDVQQAGMYTLVLKTSTGFFSRKIVFIGK